MYAMNNWYVKRWVYTRERELCVMVARVYSGTRHSGAARGCYIRGGGVLSLFCT